MCILTSVCLVFIVVLRGARSRSLVYTVRPPFLRSLPPATSLPHPPSPPLHVPHTQSPPLTNSSYDHTTASYDYGSAIKENRELTPKYDELKLQGLFLRSSAEFYKTDVLGNSSVGSGVVRVHVLSDSKNEQGMEKGEKGDGERKPFVVKLRNPESGAGFWIARQANSSDTYVPPRSLFCCIPNKEERTEVLTENLLHFLQLTNTIHTRN